MTPANCPADRLAPPSQPSTDAFDAAVGRRLALTLARYANAALPAACALWEETEHERDDVGDAALSEVKRELSDADMVTYGEYINGLNTPQAEAVEYTINAAMRAVAMKHRIAMGVAA